MLLPITPLETERRDGWEVVLEYEGEGEGPWLVDLSHRSRWDVQDRAIGEARPFGLAVPEEWGSARESDGLLINRMNRTQISIWHIGPGDAPRTRGSVDSTDTTDSHCWLAIVGFGTPRVMEALTSLDLFPPDRAGPRLTQGPVLHVPAQIVTFPDECVLIAVARGYGQTFAEAILHSAADLGIRPGGERAFSRWRDGRPG
ncbi:MAG: sarcosine oxidase subunit gamma SoxG [Gemmatimonadota bacterium]|nr:sarcosine oxidase subunit gamma SoxG [Gemmatimonadota bacterium]